MERVQKEIGKDVVLGFILCVGHNEIFIHPEQYTRAINAAIEVLEAKENKNKARKVQEESELTMTA